MKGPDVNELVILRRPGVEEDLRSRVEGTAANWLALAYPSDGSEVVDMIAGQELVVQWLTVRGLGEVNGRVAGRAAIDVPALAVDLLDEPRLLQRRADARASVWIECDARRHPKEDDPEAEEPVDADFFGVTVVDLSAGGAAILTHRQLEVDDVVSLSFALPEGRVDAVCSVRRLARENVYGLQFKRISEFDRERVIQAVFAAMRDELARRHTA